MMENRLVRVATGMPRLDAGLEGGVPENSVVLVSGKAGAGKSTFGAQVLYNGATKYGEAGVLLSFNDPARKIRENMASLGTPIEDLEAKGLLTISLVNPLQIELFAKQESIVIAELLHATNAKRIFIDSLTSFELMFKNDYERMVYTARLLSEIVKQGCTIFISSEAEGDRFSKFGIAEALVDGIIYLRLDPREQPPRTLEIIKMRATKHPLTPLPFSIGQGGMDFGQQSQPGVTHLSVRDIRQAAKYEPVLRQGEEGASPPKEGEIGDGLQSMRKRSFVREKIGKALK